MRDVTIHPTAIVGERVSIGPGSQIGPYAVVEDDVTLGRDTKLWTRAFVGRWTTLGDANQLHPGAIIGHLPQDTRFDPETETHTRIGHRNTFREYSQVHRATTSDRPTTIGDDCLLMACSHIAHDCQVGDGVILVNGASIPGHCEIGDRTYFSGFTGIHQFVRVGRLAMLAAQTVSSQDLLPFVTYAGRLATPVSINAVGLRRAGFAPETRRQIKEAYRLIYRSGLVLTEALARVEANLSAPEAQEMVTFARASKRGISYPSHR